MRSKILMCALGLALWNGAAYSLTYENNTDTDMMFSVFKNEEEATDYKAHVPHGQKAPFIALKELLEKMKKGGVLTFRARPYDSRPEQISDNIECTPPIPILPGTSDHSPLDTIKIKVEGKDGKYSCHIG